MSSMSRRFYWLKLHRDFFKRHDTRIIEAMDNGEKYMLFYMKLLVESIDHEGRLRFSDTVPYNDKMLATITDTDVDIVRSAVKVFLELGMMERYDDGTLFMNQVERMIGDETEWAKKKREYRQRKEIEDLGADDATRTLSSECPNLSSKNGTLSDKSLESRARAREERKERGEEAQNFDESEWPVVNTKDPEPAAPATLSPMKDPVSNRYQTVFMSWTPSDAWGSIPKERAGLKKLGIATRKLASVIGCTDLELTDRILAEYRKMKKSSKAEYWSNAPLTPSALLVRWDSVVAALDEAERKHRKKYEPDLVLREHRRSKGMTEEEIAKAEQDYRDFVKSCDEAWAAKGA